MTGLPPEYPTFIDDLRFDYDIGFLNDKHMFKIFYEIDDFLLREWKRRSNLQDIDGSSQIEFFQ